MRSSLRVLKTVQKLEVVPKVPANSTVFSLLQPTGNIHLGNYLGAIKAWKNISESESPNSRYIYGIADLHALTMPQDPNKLRQCRTEAVASLIAAGLDPQKCTIFHQSSVPAHTELTWILTCITGMGFLNRMTQWKSKGQHAESSSIFDDKILERTKAGLFTYPVLMAADILIYNATHVPVGDDQSQHLELARYLASSFNHQYNTDHFVIPTTLLSRSQKILSLRNPQKKMSKSDPDQMGCIYVTDDADAISKKVRKAQTDSIQGTIYYDPVQRPGVSNLISIIAGVTNRTIEEVEAEIKHMTSHKQLKDYTAEVLIEEFRPKRAMYDKLVNDPAYLQSVLDEGTAKAKAIADANITKIRTLVGLN
ncbi:hypothetical protein DIURU_005693 [Diutina rugosa]|uniref:Tryptophan--tRNA ligase, mitochondrial n=1 Tax=Diutina rugosa TaxID=5481 RepID=A0A642UCF1_DIURU|nr:uncharacterized protein DIURU_005693 [Diutina rugosa]KAA8896681.1 hypothetical protein DIURU_005693 [Diutina rugosa]